MIPAAWQPPLLPNPRGCEGTDHALALVARKREPVAAHDAPNNPAIKLPNSVDKIVVMKPARAERNDVDVRKPPTSSMVDSFDPPAA